uniref:Uncharacterized protein n=1 Tax=Spongospora subterranea TaxID=70186 RepID=A0A0H5QSV3_9EUKA|eukprot:CRZ05098.1 hypothetical protein [Spongospora subterranea]
MGEAPLKRSCWRLRGNCSQLPRDWSLNGLTRSRPFMPKQMIALPGTHFCDMIDPDDRSPHESLTTGIKRYRLMAVLDLPTSSPIQSMMIIGGCENVCTVVNKPRNLSEIITFTDATP